MFISGINLNQCLSLLHGKRRRGKSGSSHGRRMLANNGYWGPKVLKSAGVQTQAKGGEP
jgi:hypothetical protein